MKNHPAGFTLLEVIIAIAMLTMLSASFLPITAWLTVRSRTYQYDSQASLVLQQSMETAYNVLISVWDGSWATFPAGVYHPAIDTGINPNQWTLVPGQEYGVETRFDRQIEIGPVCRNPTTGKLSESYPCTGSNVEDSNSKVIKTTVSWKEAGKDKNVTAQLLVTNLGN
jgi:prepilin-type N-terminal cleavage/methylation domain-containing protein